MDPSSGECPHHWTGALSIELSFDLRACALQAHHQSSFLFVDVVALYNY
jgi:hypothetical protein